MGPWIDNNGIPVTYELFPGNTMDQSTLITSVELPSQAYGMEKITIIADRGLNGGPNPNTCAKQAMTLLSVTP